MSKYVIQALDEAALASWLISKDSLQRKEWNRQSLVFQSPVQGRSFAYPLLPSPQTTLSPFLFPPPLSLFPGASVILQRAESMSVTVRVEVGCHLFTTLDDSGESEIGSAT